MTAHTGFALGAVPEESTVVEGALAGQVVSLTELREMLIEQKRLLVQQSRAIELLDQRREEIEELIEIIVPIGNAALTRVMQKLDALEKSGVPQAGRGAVRSVRRTMAEPAPGLRQIWRRLRAPHARRGLAVILDLVETLGSGIPATGANQDRGTSNVATATTEQR